MASTNQLFIFGLFIAFTTFTAAAQYVMPYELRVERLRECQRRMANLSETLVRCINDEFSPDEGYTTMGLYNTSTACLRCKHVCRRREQIKECLMQGVETVKEVSNKAKTMLPSSVHVAEAIANYFCDNEKEMFLGLTDADLICLAYSWGYCNTALDFTHYKKDIVFCDSEDPLYAPYLYTMEYVCSTSATYFECSSNFASACSSRLASTFTALKPILLTTAPCDQYNVTGNEVE